MYLLYLWKIFSTFEPPINSGPRAGLDWKIMNASDVIVQLSIATFPQVKSMIDLFERQLSVPAIALKPHECSPPRRVRNRMQRDRVPWLWTTVTQPIEEKMSSCAHAAGWTWKISSRRGEKYHIYSFNLKMRNPSNSSLYFWLSSFILEDYTIFWNNVNFVWDLSKLRRFWKSFFFFFFVVGYSKIQKFLSRLILKEKSYFHFRTIYNFFSLSFLS